MAGPLDYILYSGIPSLVPFLTLHARGDIAKMKSFLIPCAALLPVALAVCSPVSDALVGAGIDN